MSQTAEFLFEPNLLRSNHGELRSDCAPQMRDQGGYFQN